MSDTVRTIYNRLLPSIYNALCTYITGDAGAATGKCSSNCNTCGKLVSIRDATPRTGLAAENIIILCRGNFPCTKIL